MTGVDVKAIRKKLLLLQTELADELGVHVETLKRWEQGKAEMSIKSERLVVEFCRRKNLEV